MAKRRTRYQSRSPQSSVTQSSHRQPGRRNPRVLAALCYAFPLLPALVLLFRERRNRFIRFHAAQALLFFLTLFVIQLAVFAALVVVGNLVAAFWLAVVLGLICYGALLVFGIGSFCIWLRLLAQSMSGRGDRLPLLGRSAAWLERVTWRPQAASV